MKRFWDKVNKTDTCWLWTAAKQKKGYGRFKFEGRLIGAHVMSYILINGPIETGLKVCHTCDTPACVNPAHLFKGSQSQNMQDCSAKGRLVVSKGRRFEPGYVPHNVAITAIRAKEIKLQILNKASKSLRALAEELNVPYQLLRDINRGRSYKDAA